MNASRTCLTCKVIMSIAASFLVLSAGLARAKTLYTSTEPSKCSSPSKQLIALYDAQGLDVQECKGPKGLKFLVVSTDERSWVDLQQGDQIWTTQDEVVYNNRFGYFPNIGSGVVEWNVTSAGEPSSLIFRITAQDKRKGAPIGATVSRLFVISLRQNRPAFCGVATTNEEARALSNSSGKCRNRLPVRSR